jgi:acetyl-CoA C-acetyltransferase
MSEAVIVSTARSPIGRAFKGSLKDVRPDDLAVAVITAALDKIPGLDPTLVEDLYLGCAEPSGEQGANLARVVAVLAGYDHLPGSTINRFCASSVQTTRMAFHAIKAGEGEIFISGGVECVSRYRDFAGAGGASSDVQNPKFAAAQARGAQMAADNATWTDPRELGLMPDIYLAMGQSAENIATMRGISRARQDEWGVSSQNRAEKAIAEGFFAGEITPITTPDGTVVSADDGPRSGVTLEAVSALKPVFRESGTVTAGNCCPLNDGAAAVVIMSDSRARELGLTPLARCSRHHERLQGPRAGSHSARPRRLDRPDRSLPGDHGHGPGGGIPPGTGTSRHVHRRHGPGRDQRGLRRAGAGIDR